MNGDNATPKSGIFFSCTEKQYLVREHFVPEHVLTHVLEGELQIRESDLTYSIKTGDTVLFRRNQLAKIIKVPSAQGVCKSVTIFFSQDFLQKYYARHPLTYPLPAAANMHKLQPHALLQSLFGSIIPYYDLPGNLPPELSEMKLQEAMTILRQLSPEAEAILHHFAEPGKIDLAGFMEKNFSYNISNEQFAYLTGRSLATFKRDFQKVFRMSPQKWLLQKRLEHAHFLIAERRNKPSDAYIASGFENLSHFSRSFKQFFGYNPSSIPLSVPAKSF